MTTTEPWTILRLLNWTTDYLRQHGSESPRLDAEVLLAEARGCDRIALYTAYDEVAEDTVRDTFRQLVRRRADGTPVAYLVERREFYSLSFRVTPAVLIPRPETELVVVSLLDLAKQAETDAAVTVADIGTGSGVLAICAAKHLQNAAVTGIDICEAALEVARGNADSLGVADRIRWIQSDLFAQLPESTLFDFVVSNPPYIGDDELDTLPRDVRDYEPRQALIAGDSPMRVVDRLVPASATHLRPGGWLIMEIGPRLATPVTQLLESHPDFTHCRIVKDLARLPRVAIAQRRSES